MRILLAVFAFSILISSCKQPTENISYKEELSIRKARSYAKHDYQMDSIYSRLGIEDTQNDLLWKAAISPHDNYSFAGELYYKSLRGINAPNIILIGVAHSARNYDLQDKIIFGTFDQWESPYGGIKVSSLNEDIMSRLPEDNYIVHDSMQVIEHSLEAIIPWLHRKNRSAEIVPILVPYISYDGIDSISAHLAKAVHEILKAKNWEYGKDLAIVISNDAVHYGDQEWGNTDTMAPFGTDSAGTEQARNMDLEIIDRALTNELSNDKIKMFTEYTVQQEDYKEYKWVWCGRYSVPFGLSFANKLNMLESNEALNGTFLGYQTSIDHEHVKIDDIGMTTSALTTNRHWVAYVSLVYE
jgi:AmmeMemoRadiSam system protein B